MAWNEPGGDKKDDWNNQGPRGGDEPPDLEEVIKNLQRKFGGLFGGGSDGSGGGAAGFGLGFFVLIGLFIWAVFGIYIVEQAEKAVILRFGKFHKVVEAGPHWRAPFIDTKVVVNVDSVREYEPPVDAGLMLTKDENIVDSGLTVQYVVKSVKDYVLNARNPDVILQSATESALRQVIGQTTLDRVLTIGREAVQQQTSEKLQQLLDRYQTGIQVQKVNLKKMDPPEQVKAAFSDVIKAREDREALINQAEQYKNELLPKARGEANEKVEQARGYRAEMIAAATGQAQRFTELKVEYEKAPAITKERLYLETVESVLSNTTKIVVDVEGGNQLLYIPIDKIMERKNHLATATPQSSPSAVTSPSNNGGVPHVIQSYENARDRARSRSRGIQ